MAYLDQVLALGLGDERLQLGCGEGVDQASLGDYKEKYLSAGENGQLVSLYDNKLDGSDIKDAARDE